MLRVAEQNRSPCVHKGFGHLASIFTIKDLLDRILLDNHAQRLYLSAAFTTEALPNLLALHSIAAENDTLQVDLSFVRPRAFLRWSGKL